MSNKSKRVVFIIFCVLFVAIGVAVVFYSLGWRLNLENFQIQKTGAIYIKTDPKGVVIKLSAKGGFLSSDKQGASGESNKTYADNSGILQSGTLISNLLPKTYKIKIEKESFLPYYKNIVVEQSLVTKLSKIKLIPKKIKVSEIAAVRGNKLIDAADNAQKIIALNENKNLYYLYDLNNPSSTLNINAAIDSKLKQNPEVGPEQSKTIEKIAFLPFQPNNLIIENNRDLKILDTESFTLNPLVKGPILIWTVKNSDIYFIKTARPLGPTSTRLGEAGGVAGLKNKNLALYSFNLIFRTESLLAEIPQNLSAISALNEIKASELNDKIAFSDKSGNLYIFNQNNREIKKIAHNAETFSFSPDDKKIAFLDKDGKLSIRFLEDIDSDVIKKSGDVNRIELENKENIRGIEWYKDSAHLFVNFSSTAAASKQSSSPQAINEIRFAEIDDRLPVNVYPVVNGFLQFYYEPKTDILYLIEKNKLKKIDFNE